MSRNRLISNPIPKRGVNPIIRRNELLEAQASASLMARILDGMQSEIHTGDKVMLDVEKITGRDEFKQARPEYQKFVRESEGKVFTANVRPDHIVSLQEDGGGWLFWRGDLTLQNR